MHIKLKRLRNPTELVLFSGPEQHSKNRVRLTGYSVIQSNLELGPAVSIQSKNGLYVRTYVSCEMNADKRE